MKAWVLCAVLVVLLSGCTQPQTPVVGPDGCLIPFDPNVSCGLSPPNPPLPPVVSPGGRRLERLWLVTGIDAAYQLAVKPKK